MKTFHTWISEARKKKLSDEEITKMYNALSSDAHVNKIKKEKEDSIDMQHQKRTSPRRPANEGYLRIQERGRTYSIMLNWRGKPIQLHMFFPKFTRPSKAEIAFEVRKAYPNAIILYFDPARNDPTKPLLFSGQEK